MNKSNDELKKEVEELRKKEKIKIERKKLLQEKEKLREKSLIEKILRGIGDLINKIFD